MKFPIKVTLIKIVTRIETFTDITTHNKLTDRSYELSRGELLYFSEGGGRGVFERADSIELQMAMNG